MLIKAIPAWVVATNAYVIADEPGGAAVLVDAPPEPELIGSYLAESSLTLSAIVLTHGHVDHMGGSGSVARSTGAVTYAHRDDDFLTLHPEQQLRSLLGMVPPGDFDAPEVTRDLVDGHVISHAGIDLEVVHTPGHTPGHCCLYWEAEGVLFSGDQLFAGSVGRADLPGGNWDHLMTSMRERVMVLDDEIRVLPGHGPETTIGQERAANPFRSEWQL